MSRISELLFMGISVTNRGDYGATHTLYTEIYTGKKYLMFLKLKKMQIFHIKNHYKFIVVHFV